MAIIAVCVPIGAIIIAAVSPVPGTFWYVGHVLTIFIINQGYIGTAVILWIQALTGLTMYVPVRLSTGAAVSPVPITLLDISFIMTIPIGNLMRIWAWL